METGRPCKKSVLKTLTRSNAIFSRSQVTFHNFKHEKNERDVMIQYIVN